MAVNKVVYDGQTLIDLSGDTVTAETLLEGYTAHGADGTTIAGAMAAGIDTSDATATAEDIVSPKTAYVNGEKVEGSLVASAINTTVGEYNVGIDSSGNLYMRLMNLNNDQLKGKRYLVDPGQSITLKQGSSVLGDATAEDVAEGKTFSSVNGVKLTGTHACAADTVLQEKTVTPSESQQTVSPDDGYGGLSAVTVEAVSGTYVGSAVPQKAAAAYTPGTADQVIAAGQYLSGDQTIGGDANLTAGNIKSGVSIFGVEGAYEGSGGSGGGIQAQHISSASDTITISGSGTVKVWGYGAVKSNYTTTLYAFVGDGYYKGASYGTPTKTSASFSISSGTLSGLPSGLTALDVLVTIGI